MEQKDQQNLYQQLGIIQGTLAALSTSVSHGFSNANSQLSEFKSEFKSLTDDQNRRIEKLTTDFESKIEPLQTFKDNYEGGERERKRQALLGGAGSGIVVAGLFEVIKLLIQLLK